MNFISRHINTIGILLLTTFAAVAAGMYWNAPQKIHPTAAATTASVKYVCPMHPEVTSDKPGDCPKCGMTLVSTAVSADAHAGCGTSASGGGCCGIPEIDSSMLPGQGCTRGDIAKPFQKTDTSN